MGKRPDQIPFNVYLKRWCVTSLLFFGNGYRLWLKRDVLRRNVWPHVKQSPTNPSVASWITRMKFTTPLPTFQFSNQSSWGKMRWLHLSVVILWACSLYSASADNSGVKKMKVQFATGPLLKFQIWWVRVWVFLCRSIPEQADQCMTLSVLVAQRGLTWLLLKRY